MPPLFERREREWEGAQGQKLERPVDEVIRETNRAVATREEREKREDRFPFLKSFPFEDLQGGDLKKRALR